MFFKGLVLCSLVLPRVAVAPPMLSHSSEANRLYWYDDLTLPEAGRANARSRKSLDPCISSTIGLSQT